MATTVQTLIDDAKAISYPYLREERISLGGLLRHLTMLDREIVGLYAVHAPQRISAAGTTIPVVAATNQAGYTLTTAKSYQAFTYVNADGYEKPIEIVPEGKRPSVHPSAYVRGVTFYPADPFQLNWDQVSVSSRTVYRGDGDKIKYRYIPEPPALATMAATIASPYESAPYMVSALCLQLLLMYEEVPVERMQSAAQDVQMKRALLMLNMATRTGVSARFGEGR